MNCLTKTIYGITVTDNFLCIDFLKVQYWSKSEAWARIWFCFKNFPFLSDNPLINSLLLFLRLCIGLRSGQKCIFDESIRMPFLLIKRRQIIRFINSISNFLSSVYSGYIKWKIISKQSFIKWWHKTNICNRILVSK